MKSEEQKKKENAWAKQFYDKMSDIITTEIKDDGSTPVLTMQVLARLLVGSTIAIIGYEKAAEALSGMINQQLEVYRKKKKEKEQ